MAAQRRLTERIAVMMRWRPVAFVLTAAVAGCLLAYGIFREEIGEVMFNAAML